MDEAPVLPPQLFTSLLFSFLTLLLRSRGSRMMARMIWSMGVMPVPPAIIPTCFFCTALPRSLKVPRPMYSVMPHGPEISRSSPTLSVSTYLQGRGQWGGGGEREGWRGGWKGAAGRGGWGAHVRRRRKEESCSGVKPNCPTPPMFPCSRDEVQ